ncbi:MAG TPA: hypothetical protein ENG66_00130 [Thermococcus sp.]|nr:hypothetical protein [Thermococcus sp.]
MADKSYDSDILRWKLRAGEIKPCLPRRKNALPRAGEEALPSERYRERWKVERTFVWLFNFRRFVVSGSKVIMSSSLFLLIACIIILLGVISG